MIKKFDCNKLHIFEFFIVQLSVPNFYDLSQDVHKFIIFTEITTQLNYRHIIMKLLLLSSIRVSESNIDKI